MEGAKRYKVACVSFMRVPAEVHRMSQLQSHTRYRGALVSITGVRCRPSTPLSSGKE
jgi:hypothetical protein